MQLFENTYARDYIQDLQIDKRPSQTLRNSGAMILTKGSRNKKKDLEAEKTTRKQFFQAKSKSERNKFKDII